MAEAQQTEEQARAERDRVDNDQIKEMLSEQDIKSDFFMEVPVKLDSPQAKRIFKRSFEHLQTQITAATMLTRKFNLRELSDKNVKRINEALQQLLDEMKHDIDSANAIMQATDLDVEAVTPDRVEVLAKVSCPEGMKMLNLIRQLDMLATKLKTLWMTGELSLAHSEDRVHAWQVRIFKTASAIRTIGQEAYIATDRKRQQDEAKAKAKRNRQRQRQSQASQKNQQAPAQEAKTA